MRVSCDSPNGQRVFRVLPILRMNQRPKNREWDDGIDEGNEVQVRETVAVRIMLCSATPTLRNRSGKRSANG
jgi:hypothetical protein